MTPATGPGWPVDGRWGARSLQVKQVCRGPLGILNGMVILVSMATTQIFNHLNDHWCVFLKSCRSIVYGCFDDQCASELAYTSFLLSVLVVQGPASWAHWALPKAIRPSNQPTLSLASQPEIYLVPEINFKESLEHSCWTLLENWGHITDLDSLCCGVFFWHPLVTDHKIIK